MGSKNMDVFSLRDSIVGEYRKFATSFTTIHAEDIREQVQAIYAKGRFWPEPLIQINPSYKRGVNLKTLIADGALDPRTGGNLPGRRCAAVPLQAPGAGVVLAAQGESYVVTTGTGSGKSLCFFIPIVSAVLAEKRSKRSATHARHRHLPDERAGEQPARGARQVRRERRRARRPSPLLATPGRRTTRSVDASAENPPDILLTNFMMLELLMTRQEELDRKVIGNCAGFGSSCSTSCTRTAVARARTLRLLVRRVRERLSPDKLQCIGTSATMASEGTLEDKQGSSRASRPSSSRHRSIRATSSSRSSSASPTSRSEPSRCEQRARPAIDAGIPANITDAALRSIRSRSGSRRALASRRPTRTRRGTVRRPRTLDEAASELERGGGPRRDCVRGTRCGRSSSSRAFPRRDRTGNESGSTAASSPSSCTSSSRAPAMPSRRSSPGQAHGHGRRTAVPAGRARQAALPRPLLPRLRARVPPRSVRADDGRADLPRRATSTTRRPARATMTNQRSRGRDRPIGEVFGFLTPHARDAEFTFTTATRTTRRRGSITTPPATARSKPLPPRARSRGHRRARREGGRRRQGVVHPRPVPVLPSLRGDAQRVGARPHAARVAVG